MKFYCYDSKNLSLKKESVLNNIKRNYVFYIIFSLQLVYFPYVYLNYYLFLVYLLKKFLHLKVNMKKFV